MIPANGNPITKYNIFPKNDVILLEDKHDLLFFFLFREFRV